MLTSFRTRLYFGEESRTIEPQEKMLLPTPRIGEGVVLFGVPYLVSHVEHALFHEHYGNEESLIWETRIVLKPLDGM